MTVSHFSVFQKIHICADQTSATNAGELEAFCVSSVQRTFQCRLLRRHSSVESQFKVFCTTYKRVLKLTAVPSILKRNADVAEKKAQKSTAIEKVTSKRVSSVCRVSHCLSQCTATEWVIAVMPDADNNNIIDYECRPRIFYNMDLLVFVDSVFYRFSLPQIVFCVGPFDYWLSSPRK